MSVSLVVLVLVILAAIASVAAAFYFGVKNASLSVQAENLRTRLSELESAHERALEQERSAAEKLRQELRDNYDKSLQEIRTSHQESLDKQSKAYEAQKETLKTEMLAKTEEILKKRQEELDKKAAQTLETITGSLGKDLKDMKTAFEANKTQSSEDSASMKEKLENAVKQLAAQTKNIGDKADNLADAMRGQKKMQGCWGEVILKNLLDAEGLVEKRDYDREETLRDELGIVIKNDDTDQRMRPDFIVHFIDNQDVVIDSKVSLTSYADYCEANDEDSRKEAEGRNLKAIRDQVEKLSVKNYSKYLKPGHQMVDYVIMFVPNYPALQLAYNLDSGLWRWAYEKKVLITSQETLMPFLRSVMLAWRNVEQLKNQENIIKSAQNMIERVAEFAGSMQRLGKALEDANKAFSAADKKLKNSNKGILVSAHQIVNYGVPLSKRKIGKGKKELVLPPTETVVETDDENLAE